MTDERSAGYCTRCKEYYTIDDCYKHKHPEDSREKSNRTADGQLLRDEGTLHKAIEKAVRNGYDFKLVRVESETVVESRYDTEFEWHYTTLIFGHDFAKAFWGEGKTWVCSCGYSGPSITDKDGWPDNPHPCSDEGSYGHTVIAWQYHLQQMVLEEDPMQYLAKFLEDK